MATKRKPTRRYATYGSMAYQPEYERGTAAPARRAQEPQRAPRPRVRPRQQPVTRPSVEVRRQSAVAPFAILGFAAVVMCALLLVMTSAQLAMANDETVTLQSTLSELQGEEQKLLAQYELTYDLAAIEASLTGNGTMVKAGAGQSVYLDLSGEDSVVYYAAAEEGLPGLIRQVEQFLAGLLT